jgi:hypothetical protein
MAENPHPHRGRYDVTGNVEAEFVDAEQTLLVNKLGITLTPFPKTEPGDVRESNQPEGLERILYEEATQCGADRGDIAASRRVFGERTEGPRCL